MGWKRASRVPLKSVDNNCSCRSAGLRWNVLQIQVRCLLLQVPNQVCFPLFSLCQFLPWRDIPQDIAEFGPALDSDVCKSQVPQGRQSPSLVGKGPSYPPKMWVRWGRQEPSAVSFPSVLLDQAPEGFLCWLQTRENSRDRWPKWPWARSAGSVGKAGGCSSLGSSLCLQPCTPRALTLCPWQLYAAPLALSHVLLQSSRQQQIASNHQEKPSVSFGQCFPLSHAVLLHKLC